MSLSTISNCFSAQLTASSNSVNNPEQQEAEITPIVVHHPKETSEDRQRALAKSLCILNDDFWLIGPLKPFDQTTLDLLVIEQAIRTELLKPITIGNRVTNLAEIWCTQYESSIERNENDQPEILDFHIIGSTVVKLLGEKNRSLILDSVKASKLDNKETKDELSVEPNDLDVRSVSLKQNWDEKVSLTVDAIFLNASKEEKESLYKMEFGALQKKIKEDFGIDVRTKGADYIHICFPKIDFTNKDTRGPSHLSSASNIRIVIAGHTLTRSANSFKFKIVCDDGEHPAQALIHKALKIHNTRKPEEKDNRAAIVYAIGSAQGQICPNTHCFNSYLDTLLLFWKSTRPTPCYAKSMELLICNISQTHIKAVEWARVSTLLKLEAASSSELFPYFSEVWRLVFQNLTTRDSFLALLLKTRIDNHFPAAFIEAILGISGFFRLSIPCSGRKDGLLPVHYTEQEKKPTVRFSVGKETYLHIPLEIGKHLIIIRQVYFEHYLSFSKEKGKILAQLFQCHFAIDNYSGRGSSSLKNNFAINAHDFPFIKSTIETFFIAKDPLLYTIALALTSAYALNGNNDAANMLVYNTIPSIIEGEGFTTSLVKQFVLENSEPAQETAIHSYFQQGKWYLALAASSRKEFHQYAINHTPINDLECLLIQLTRTNPDYVVQYLTTVSVPITGEWEFKRFALTLIKKLPSLLIATYYNELSARIDFDKDLQFKIVEHRPEIWEKIVLNDSTNPLISSKAKLETLQKAFQIERCDKFLLLQNINVSQAKQEGVWQLYCKTLIYPFIEELLSSQQPFLIALGKNLKKGKIELFLTDTHEKEEFVIEYCLFQAEQSLLKGHINSTIAQLAKISSAYLDDSLLERFKKCFSEVFNECLKLNNLFVNKCFISLLSTLNESCHPSFDLIWSQVNSINQENISEVSQKQTIATFYAETAILRLPKHPEIIGYSISSLINKLTWVFVILSHDYDQNKLLLAHLSHVIANHPILSKKQIRLNLNTPQIANFLDLLLKNQKEVAASRFLRYVSSKYLKDKVPIYVYKLARRWKNLPHLQWHLQQALSWLRTEKGFFFMGEVYWFRCAIRWLSAAQNVKLLKEQKLRLLTDPKKRLQKEKEVKQFKEHTESFTIFLLNMLSTHLKTKNDAPQVFSTASSILIAENIMNLKDKTFLKVSEHTWAFLASILVKNLSDERHRVAFLNYLQHISPESIVQIPLPKKLALLKELSFSKTILPHLHKNFTSLQLQNFADFALPNIRFFLNMFYFLWHRKQRNQAFTVLKTIVRLGSLPGITPSNRLKTDLTHLLSLFDVSQISHCFSLLNMLKQWSYDKACIEFIDENFTKVLQEGSLVNAIEMLRLSPQPQHISETLAKLLNTNENKKFEYLSSFLEKYNKNFSLQDWNLFWTNIQKDKKFVSIENVFALFKAAIPFDNNEETISTYLNALMALSSFNQSPLSLIDLHPSLITSIEEKNIPKEFKEKLIMLYFERDIEKIVKETSIDIIKLWNTLQNLTSNKLSLFNYGKKLFTYAFEHENDALIASTSLFLCSCIQKNGNYRQTAIDLLNGLKKWPQKFNASLFKLLQVSQLYASKTPSPLPPLEWLLRFENDKALLTETFLLLNKALIEGHIPSLLDKHIEKILRVCQLVLDNEKLFYDAINLLKELHSNCPHNKRKISDIIIRALITEFDLQALQNPFNVQSFQKLLSFILENKKFLKEYHKDFEIIEKQALTLLQKQCFHIENSPFFRQSYLEFFKIIKDEESEHSLIKQFLENFLDALNNKSQKPSQNYLIKCIIGILEHYCSQTTHDKKRSYDWLKTVLEKFAATLLSIDRIPQEVELFFNNLGKYRLYPSNEINKVIYSFKLYIGLDIKDSEIIKGFPDGISYLTEMVLKRDPKNCEHFFGKLSFGVYLKQVYAHNLSERCRLYKQILSHIHSPVLLAHFIIHLKAFEIFGSDLKEHQCLQALEIHAEVLKKCSELTDKVLEDHVAPAVLLYFNQVADYFTKVLALKLQITDKNIDMTLLWKNYLIMSDSLLDIADKILTKYPDEEVFSEMQPDLSSLCIRPVTCTIVGNNNPENNRKRLYEVFSRLLKLRMENLVQLELGTTLAMQNIFSSPLDTLAYFPPSFTPLIAKAASFYIRPSDTIEEVLCSLRTHHQNPLENSAPIHIYEYLCYLSFTLDDNKDLSQELINTFSKYFKCIHSSAKLKIVLHAITYYCESVQAKTNPLFEWLLTHTLEALSIDFFLTAASETKKTNEKTSITLLNAVQTKKEILWFGYLVLFARRQIPIPIKYINEILETLLKKHKDGIIHTSILLKNLKCIFHEKSVLSEISLPILKAYDELLLSIPPDNTIEEILSECQTGIALQQLKTIDNLIENENWKQFLQMIISLENSTTPNKSKLIEIIWNQVSKPYNIEGMALAGYIFHKHAYISSQMPALDIVEKLLAMPTTRTDDIIMLAIQVIKQYQITNENVLIKLFVYALNLKNNNISIIEALKELLDTLPITAKNPQIYKLFLGMGTLANQYLNLPWMQHITGIFQQCNTFKDPQEKKTFLLIFLQNAILKKDISDTDLLKYFNTRILYHGFKEKEVYNEEISKVDDFLFKKIFSSKNLKTIEFGFQLLAIRTANQLEKTDRIVPLFSLLLSVLKDALTPSQEPIPDSLIISYQKNIGISKKQSNFNQLIQITQTLAEMKRDVFFNDICELTSQIMGHIIVTPDPMLTNKLSFLMATLCHQRKFYLMPMLNWACNNRIFSKEQSLTIQYESLRIDACYGNVEEWNRCLEMAKKPLHSKEFTQKIAITLIDLLLNKFLQSRNKKEFKKQFERVLTTFDYQTKSKDFSCAAEFPQLIYTSCWNRSRKFALKLILFHLMVSKDIQELTKRQILLDEAYELVSDLFKDTHESEALGKALTSLLHTPLAHHKDLFTQHLLKFQKTIHCYSNVKNFPASETKLWDIMFIPFHILPPTELLPEHYQRAVKLLMSTPSEITHIQILEIASKAALKCKFKDATQIKDILLSPLLKCAQSFKDNHLLALKSLKTIIEILEENQITEKSFSDSDKMLQEYFDLFHYVFQKKDIFELSKKETTVPLLKLLISFLRNQGILSIFQKKEKDYYTTLSVFLTYFIGQLKLNPSPSILDACNDFTHLILEEDIASMSEHNHHLRAITIQKWLSELAQVPKGKLYAKDCFTRTIVLKTLQYKYDIIAQIYNVLTADDTSDSRQMDDLL